jgi:cytochrome c556
MRKPTRLLTTTLLTGLLLAGPVLAEDLSDPEEILTARHGYMLLMANQLVPLGAMAKGEMLYDAAAATRAAASLAALATVDTSMLWVAGTENGVLDDSDMLPEAVSDSAGRDTRMAELKTAADALAVAAGTDQDSLKAAMGGVGAACGACHKAYRKAE